MLVLYLKKIFLSRWSSRGNKMCNCIEGDWRQYWQVLEGDIRFQEVTFSPYPPTLLVLQHSYSNCAGRRTLYLSELAVILHQQKTSAVGHHVVRQLTIGAFVVDRQLFKASSLLIHPPAVRNAVVPKRSVKVDIDCSCIWQNPPCLVRQYLIVLFSGALWYFSGYCVKKKISFHIYVKNAASQYSGPPRYECNLFHRFDRIM